MSTPGEAKAREKQQTAGRLLIRSLMQQNVKYIFGIPGGKIMPTFDVLRDEGPQLIVCRHEQNAAFMAAAVGRLTGRPGVCLVTSGPGTGNLVTGAATATTEGDPMVAIGGIVPLADTLKQTHQSMDSVAIMKPVTKFSVAINAPEAAGEAVVNAFRAAMTPRAGASFIAFPRDVQGAVAEVSVPPSLPLPSLGAAPVDLIRKAAEKISNAKNPVILLGMGASDPDATTAVRALLKRHPVPVVGTFQGRGLHFARAASIVLRTRGALSQPARRQSARQGRCRADRWVRSRGIRSEFLECWQGARHHSSR